MRILLTNNHLARFGGSETWTLTMARELIRQGHDVGVFTHHKGVVSDLLKDNLDDNPQDYDLALINHNTCTDVDAKRKIFTSHGVVPPEEVPPAGMDVYVAVSENVANKYGIETIIKNPIDTNQFKPTTEIKDTPERVLSITEKPIPVQHITPTRYAETMPELMNRVDLVVTIGRGVLEAMSCGRNVIIYDHRTNLGYTANGYLEDIPSTLTGNVGGSYTLENMDFDTEVAKYKKEHGKRNRAYILENHAVEKIVEHYLNL